MSTVTQCKPSVSVLLTVPLSLTAMLCYGLWFVCRIIWWAGKGHHQQFTKRKECSLCYRLLPPPQHQGDREATTRIICTVYHRRTKNKVAKRLWFIHVQCWQQMQLTKFLLSEWQSQEYTQFLGERDIYFVCAEDCYKLCSQDGVSTTESCVVELWSSHEEADTCIILHCMYAAQCAVPVW